MLKQLSRLFYYINPGRRVELTSLFILMIVASFSELISIGAVIPFLGILTDPNKLFDNKLLYQVIKVLQIKSGNELLLPITLFFSFAIIISGILRWKLATLQLKLSYKISSDFSVEMYKKTLYQPYSVHLSRNSSVVISGIWSKSKALSTSVIMPFMTILSSCIMIIAIMTTFLYFFPTIMMAICTALSTLYMLIFLFTRKNLMKYSKIESMEQTKLLKSLQEGLGGIRDIIIDGTQELYIKIYRNRDSKLREAQAQIQIIGNSPRFAFESIAVLLIILVSYLLTIKSSGGLISFLPVIGAVIFGAQKLLPVIQQVYSSWTLIKGSQASLSDSLELLDQKNVNMPRAGDIGNSVKFENQIIINCHTFNYENSDQIVLKNINLSIRKGARVGFIGTTGSGKSTLVDIIMGLLPLKDGFVQVDSTKINYLNINNWQSHISHVPQMIFLADSTIMENIAFGVEKHLIDQEKVKNAAKSAQISKTIEMWPEGYNTTVGERGMKLSGGQRQRIGIARALYKNSDLIIFDEATSALDNETENEVIEAIENLDKKLTVLMVAHRLTTLKKCDMIVELKNGEIKTIGTYQEIINK